MGAYSSVYACSQKGILTPTSYNSTSFELPDKSYSLSVTEPVNDAGSFELTIPLVGDYIDGTGLSGIGQRLFSESDPVITGYYGQHLIPSCFIVPHTSNSSRDLILLSEKVTIRYENGVAKTVLSGTLGNGMLSRWTAWNTSPFSTTMGPSLADNFGITKTYTGSMSAVASYIIGNNMNATGRPNSDVLVTVVVSSANSDSYSLAYGSNNTILDCLKLIASKVKNSFYLGPYQLSPSPGTTPFRLLIEGWQDRSKAVVFSQNKDLSSFSIGSELMKNTFWFGSIGDSKNANSVSGGIYSNDYYPNIGYWSERKITPSSTVDTGNTYNDNWTNFNNSIDDAQIEDRPKNNASAVIASENSGFVFARDYDLGDIISFDVMGHRFSSQLVTHSFTLGDGDYKEGIQLGGNSSWI